MCYMQWVTSPKCALKHDSELGYRVIKTRSDGFFQHGFIQKRTANCQRSQEPWAHCSDIDTKKPKYRKILASAQKGDQKYFLWDPEVLWTRDVNGERVVDERCRTCRMGENARAR